VSGEIPPGPVLVGIRSEHVQVGVAREGAVACTAKLLFTEDVGGSEILYLEVDGVPMSTVLGSGSEALASIGSGSLNIAVDPSAFVLFDPVGRTRVGQGVQRG
jgi:ABC-type sugar transport system ATPase subunit